MRRSFTFRGENSGGYGIVMSSAARLLIPEKRKNLIYVPGRDGMVDASLSENYANIAIQIDCGFLAASHEDLRTTAREIAGWLSRSGELEFSDEPGKFYDAQVISEIPIEQQLRTGRFTITFNCFPFAMSRPNVMTFVITQTEQNNAVMVRGTANTPVVLTLKNTGTVSITGIQFGHKSQTS